MALPTPPAPRHTLSSGASEGFSELIGLMRDAIPQFIETCLGTINDDFSLTIDAQPTIAYPAATSTSAPSSYMLAEWLTWGGSYLAAPVKTDVQTVGDHGTHDHTMPWQLIFPPLHARDRVVVARVMPGLGGHPTVPVVLFRVTSAVLPF